MVGHRLHCLKQKGEIDDYERLDEFRYGVILNEEHGEDPLRMIEGWYTDDGGPEYDRALKRNLGVVRHH
jgi:hypothetical protein